MADTTPLGDEFVNSQYQDGQASGGGGEVALSDFVEGQYSDEGQVATSWGCPQENCEVENSLDTTVCVGCGYDYAAADEVSGLSICRRLSVSVSVSVCVCLSLSLSIYICLYSSLYISLSPCFFLVNGISIKYLSLLRVTPMKWAFIMTLLGAGTTKRVS